MKRFAFLMAFVLLLTGCAKSGPKVPQKTFPAVTYITEQESGEWTTPEPLPTIEEMDRGDLSYVRGRLEEDLKAEYPNVSIVGARVPDSEDMPVVNIEFGIAPDYDLKQLAERLFGGRYDINDETLYREKYPDDPIDSSIPAEGNNRIGIYFKIYEPDPADVTMSAYMNSTGNLNGSQRGYTADKRTYSETEFDSYETYCLDYNMPSADLSYKMSDGEEWNALEAIDYIEDFWNVYVAQSDPEECTYRVKRLTVIDFEDGTYGYLFDMEKKDKSGNYIEMDPYSSENLMAAKAGQPFMCGCSLVTWCPAKETITRFSKYLSFSESEPESSGSSIITLAKAGQILSQTLPKELGHEYTAELNYVIFCKGYPNNSSDGRFVFSSTTLMTECEFELRPYWCIRRSEYNSLDERYLETVYIDALTGELTIRFMGNWFTASMASDIKLFDILAEYED